MKFQVKLVPVTQVCLGIYFAFKLSFFLAAQPSRGVVLEGGALEVCSASAGKAPVPGCNLNKVAM